MKHYTQDDGVKLMLKTDFEPDRLSPREIEALRMILPQLMIEMVQSMPGSEDEE